MPYEPRFDIPRYNFTEDLAFGEASENIVKQFLQAMSSGSIEVKHDRYRNGRIAIETDQYTPAGEWKLSGINVTTAEWLVYMQTNQTFTIINIPRLKRFLRMNKRQIIKGPLAKGEYPTLGYLLMPHHVHDLMNSTEYD